MNNRFFALDALENTLMEGGKWKEEKDDKADKKTRYYEKYLRLWHMLEAFSEKEFIPRRDMIRHVFQGIAICPILKKQTILHISSINN